MHNNVSYYFTENIFPQDLFSVLSRPYKKGQVDVSQQIPLRAYKHQFNSIGIIHISLSNLF